MPPELAWMLGEYKSMKKPSQTDTFCSYPFTDLAVKNFRGSRLESIAPCCMMTDATKNEPPTWDRLKIDNVGDLNPEEIFNHPRLQLLRKNLLAGIKDSACVVCWEQEERNLISYRQMSPAIEQNQVDEPTLTTLDLTPSNVCNLRCRMCAPSTSNSLMIDQRYFEKNSLAEDYLDASGRWTFNSDPTKVTDSMQWQWLLDNTDKVKIIKASGGEPFYDKRVIELINRYIINDTAKSTVLRFHTNGTVIDDELIEKLNKFQGNEHTFSIDGFEKTYDYIRYPAKFEEINLAIRNYTSKIKNLTQFHISLVVSSLNLLSLPHYIQWVDSLKNDQKYHTYLNFAEISPSRRGTDVCRLPIHLLTRALNEITQLDTTIDTSNLIKIIKYAIDNNEEDKSRMLREILPFDRARDQTYHDFLDPELVAWLSSG